MVSWLFCQSPKQEANMIKEDFLDKVGLKLDISKSFQTLRLWYLILLGLSSCSSFTTSYVSLSKLASVSFNSLICKLGIIKLGSKFILRIK